MPETARSRRRFPGSVRTLEIRWTRFPSLMSRTVPVRDDNTRRSAEPGRGVYVTHVRYVGAGHFTTFGALGKSSWRPRRGPLSRDSLASVASRVSFASFESPVRFLSGPSLNSHQMRPSLHLAAPRTSTCRHCRSPFARFSPPAAN